MIINSISYFIVIIEFIVSIASLQISKNLNLYRNLYIYFDHNASISSDWCHLNENNDTIGHSDLETVEFRTTALTICRVMFKVQRRACSTCSAGLTWLHMNKTFPIHMNVCTGTTKDNLCDITYWNKICILVWY